MGREEGAVRVSREMGPGYDEDPEREVAHGKNEEEEDGKT